MPDTEGADAPVVRHLHDGLVLRSATPADADALAEFNAEIHREPDRSEPDYAVAVWTRDLLAGTHPSVSARDFTIVEEAATGAIVSSMCLLDQVWTYAGLPFAVGRTELVGTRPDYRGRGLIRAQFDTIHAWSTARGQQVQAITGIPFYYRQFGYEMAVNLGGGRAGFSLQVPALPEGEVERFRIRPADAGDLPLIDRLYAQYCARSLLACPRDRELLRYEIDGRSERNFNRRAVCIVETSAGESIGLLVHTRSLLYKRASVFVAELVPGLGWLDVAPSLLRYMIAAGARYAERDHGECTGYAISLLPDHPLYRVIPGLLPIPYRPYAWYLRVPDLVGFLRLITPVLEARLANSPAAGYTGALTIGMYRSGVRLAFENGRISAVEAWQPQPNVGGSVQFPGLSFLQVLFGYRTLEELRYAFPDCQTDEDRAAVLIDALFPKQASYVWPID